MNTTACRSAGLLACLMLAGAAAHGDRDVGLVQVDEAGCPTGVSPETDACPAQDRRPDRICRGATRGMFQPNRNQLLWQYADRTVAHPFTISFKNESPFTQECGDSVDSRDTGRPTTPRCVIRSTAAVDTEYHYRVIVHRPAGDCELDPHIYVKR